MSPQPFSVEWSPSTTPTATPDFEPLGRVAEAVSDRGRGSRWSDQFQAGTIKAKVRNGNNAGETPVHLLADWRRHTRTRLVVDIGGVRPVNTGYITRFEHDLAEAPYAALVNLEATDALGVWNHQTYEEVTFANVVAFPPVTVVDIADTLNVLTPAVDTVDASGVARAPVTFPATVIDTDGSNDSRFTSNAFDALRKGLDVELGTVHVAADGTLAINGRYAVADAVAGATPPVAFGLTNLAADVDGSTVWAYRRGSLKFADPLAEFYNGAAVAGIPKATVKALADSFVTGDFEEFIERLDLYAVDNNWINANAQLLADLYAGVREPWPSEVAVTVWDTAMADLNLLEAVLDATDILGRSSITLGVTQPGTGTQIEYLATIEGIRLTVGAAQAVATLRLGAGGARWRSAYDLSVGIFRLGGAGLGLGSGAILGP